MADLMDRETPRRFRKVTNQEPKTKKTSTAGPSAGFDIRSFEENGSDRFIEAKTTKYGKYAPFFLTPNELEFSRDNAANYHLYRLFQFGKSPRLFTLSGYVEERCQLKPSEYIARVTETVSPA